MGKAAPKGIKTRANYLLKKFEDKFSNDFEKNKEFIESMDLPISNTNRNLIAGYITRKVKQKIKS